MQDTSQTLRFLISYGLEVQKLIPWGAWGLLLHQSVRWSSVSLMLDPLFILDNKFFYDSMAF
jgi:hypothetical protein